MFDMAPHLCEFGLFDIMHADIAFTEQCIEGKQPTPEQMELRLIQSKEDIETPPPLQFVLGTGME